MEKSVHKNEKMEKKIEALELEKSDNGDRIKAMEMSPKERKTRCLSK